MTMTATPLQLLSDHARLPGAAVLLEPEQLSTLLGREITLDRVRIKPTASVLVSYRATVPAGTRGQDLAGVGWVQLVASRDKRGNILHRAERSGTEILEHTTTADGPYLLSGGLDSDPRLGREIHRLLHRCGDETALRVLSYNPGRHAVLLLPDSGEVLRIAARPLDDLLRVGECWRELGLPTVAQRRWRGRPSVLIGGQWGQGDLAGLSCHPHSMPAAARLGEIIARLHAADVSGHNLPAARIGDPVPATAEAVAELLPHRAQQVEQLTQRLRATLTTDGPLALIHGDLSPDQVLISVDETAVPGEGHLPLRVVDLDRSGLGPRSADLGSWIASCLLAGVEEQATAFLRGYTRHLALPPSAELAAWTARALLSSALDPLRRHRDDWMERVERRLALAEIVLERPGRLPLPAPAPAAPSTGEQQRLVPTTVTHDGRVLTVHRAWADDGRGLPLELEDSAPTRSGARLRAARLDPATGQVTVLEDGTDPRLPALARVLGEHPSGTVVSHRPGKRAVVRLEGGEGSEGEHAGTRYVKIVRPGRAAPLLEAIDRSTAFEGPFRTARVLDADDDTVTFAELPGHLLHDGLPTADGTWRRAWRETLDAWTTAVETSRDRARTATLHGPAAEAEVLEAWGGRADAVDPAGAVLRGRALTLARRELLRLEDVERPALIHRDLHDKQILWQEGDRPALLDVDTATAGDPALDAANLRAHATWRELQGIWTEEQAAVVRDEIDRAAARSGIPPETLAAYESGTIARLACVYAFRPRWRGAARILAASLEPAGPGPASRASLPAPAAEDTPLGGAVAHLERSMS
ncbi:MAG: phosphotransferase [Brachybacterium sp.]|uniref:phosphotransferase n=1 Tax=unclassified Brachybacterium TaxID=2623841 RepID=UPI003F91DC46